MPSLSIVMPAYNAEKYIGQAFDSLIAQTYTDWECVVVNDGSTDRTLSIIECYAQKEHRIRYKSIKNTGSAKVPRDMAIEMADSEWIVALDADDWLAADVLEKLVKRQMQTNADVVILKLILAEENGTPTDFSIPANNFDFTSVFTGKQAAALTVQKSGWVIPCNGLINKKIYNAREKNSNHMNADEYDSRVMLFAASKVVLVDVNYFYRGHKESITRKPTSKVFESLITNRMLVSLFERNFGAKSELYNIVYSNYIESLLGAYVGYGVVKSSMTNQEQLKSEKLIKEERKNITAQTRRKANIALKLKLINMLPISLQCLLGILYSKIR